MKLFEFELRGAGEVFDIAVAAGLVELVRGETCTGSRRIRLDGIALVEIAFLV